jgi:hypothetical protein
MASIPAHRSIASDTHAFDGYLAAFALLSVLAFAAVCAYAQVIRQDLDPLNAPLSLYLTGAFGAWVRTAYYGLAAGLLALAWTSFRATPARIRSGVPALLFAVAGVALPLVALTAIRSGSGDAHEPLARLVHGVAAQTTFLCMTVAMLLQGWRWRGEPAFLVGARSRWLLAVSAFAMLWINVLVRSWPRGLTQKALIVLILFWLGSATAQVWRATRRGR